MVTHALRTTAEAVPLDPELNELATISLGDQPDLREVAVGVIIAVSMRTEAWYRERYPGHNTEQESDDYVRNLVNTIFFDADLTATVF